MKTLKLAIKSAQNRKVSLLLTIATITISLLLILAIDTIGKQTKRTFISTVSHTDLIVGARSGPLNILLYSIFHIGDATNAIKYQTYQEISQMPQVKWAVPLALGDSHRGFRVIGTTADYFTRYHYGNKQPLAFHEGSPFTDLYDVVIGHDVAQTLGYGVGEQVVVAHGMAETDYSKHDDQPFRVIGVLAKTGTPVDKSLLVSLQAIEAIHVGWQTGAKSPLRLSTDTVRSLDLAPKSVTAMLVGLHNPVHTFKTQRQINAFAKEPLQAIIPGVTLAKLWQSLGKFEQVLKVVASLVLVTGMIGLLTSLLATLNERRREMAVLRAIGAHAYDIVLLFVLESVLVVFSSTVLAVGALYALAYALQPILQAHYGIYLQAGMLDAEQLVILLVANILAVLLSLIPGWLAYHHSLADGLVIKT